MSDSPAQNSAGLVHRLVGDPHSTIGQMIKRGFTGTTRSAAPQTQALDMLEMAIAEAEKTPSSAPSQSVSSAPPSSPDPVAEGLMSQVMPQAMTQTANALDPSLTASSTTHKEAIESTASLDQVAMDAAKSVQLVEKEVSPEIPPEVESYLQKVEDSKNTAPPEIVIADGSKATPNDHPYPAQPVVVLPITAEEEKVGAKKNPKFSIRWLVEWSRRLMKVFAGKIIYRPIEESAT